MRGKLLIGVVVLVASAAIVATASATKPGSGSSTGTAEVFVPNPVQSLGNELLTDQRTPTLPCPRPHTTTFS